jgi:hypothetical protein
MMALWVVTNVLQGRNRLLSANRCRRPGYCISRLFRDDRVATAAGGDFMTRTTRARLRHLESI